MNKQLLSSIASALLPLCSASAMPIMNYSYTRSYLNSSRAKNHAVQSSLSVAELFDLQSNNHFQTSPNKLAIHQGNMIQELVIIDAAVPDKHLLYQKIKPGVDVVEIKSSDNGLTALKKILLNYQDLKALHIVSHAKDGEIFLGNSQINQDSLANSIQVLAALDNSLKDGADVLFYGCELAKTQKGEELLELIANQANVDVAASNDLTGATDKQGDWELEIQRGQIDTDLPFSEIALKNFASVLAITDGAGGTINFDSVAAGIQQEPTHIAMLMGLAMIWYLKLIGAQEMSFMPTMVQ